MLVSNEWCGGRTRLIGEFTVRVAAEQGRADLGQQLLRDQLQAGLQRVVDLEFGYNLCYTSSILH